MFYCVNATGLAAASHKETHHCSDLLSPLKTVIIIQAHTQTHTSTPSERWHPGARMLHGAAVLSFSL